MIKYDNIVIEMAHFNSHISGTDNNYEFFEILGYSAVKHLSGENVICVAYYITDTFQRFRNYSHISYHKNLKDFFKTDDKEWSGIYNMLFKSVGNENEAATIINDIKSKHSFRS
jgi:endo-alpha-1,4-polygalactosaminidase (GH114 family)